MQEPRVTQTHGTFSTTCGVEVNIRATAESIWRLLTDAKDVPRWNFHKYLIGRDGYIADVFPESVEPLDTRVKTALARSLADS